MTSLTDYIIVDWVVNKFYTLMENTKNVKLNDLVTCNINNTKDNGVVIFVGTEKDCKQLLVQLRRDELKKSKNEEQNASLTSTKLKRASDDEHHTTIGYLDDENIIYTDDNESDDLIINGIESFPSTASPIREDNKSNDVEFEAIVDEEIRFPQQQQQQHQPPSTNKRRRLGKLKNADKTLVVDEGGAKHQPCNQCECCKAMQKQINSLSERLRQLENAVEVPNEVLQWFENMKSMKNSSKSVVSTARDATDLQNLLKKIPVESAKLKQCTVPYSATATARNIIRALVPEKRLLAEMYLEDLEKVFGVESLNAIVDYCHLKFGEPKEIIKNSISNVMSKARQYLKSKTHEEILEHSNIS